MSEARTVVGIHRALTTLVVLGAAAAAGAAGWWLPAFSGWLSGLPWLPAQGLVDEVARHADVGSGPVRAVVGAVLGAVLGALVLTRATLVEVGPEDLVVRAGSERSRWPRSRVAAVALEGDRLSLRGDDELDLVSTKVDSDPRRLRDALDRHGWPLT